MSNAPRAARVVCVLASDSPGRYVELTVAAADFLKATNGDIDRVLLLDRATEGMLAADRSGLKKCFSTVIIDHHQEPTPKAASRALKLRARRLVSGDFIYLDTDAFAIDDLSSMWRAPGDVAFARDIGMDRTRFSPENIWVREHERLGWKITCRHFNGGAFLARDTAGAYAFFDGWWERWQTFRSTGRCVDQPALDQTIVSGVAEVGVLPPRFNAVFAVEARHVRRAAVLHFLVGNTEGSTTILDRILEEVRIHGHVQPQTIARLRKTRYPWRDEDQPRRQWYAGNYCRALQAVGMRSIARLRLQPTQR